MPRHAAPQAKPKTAERAPAKPAGAPAAAVPVVVNAEAPRRLTANVGDIELQGVAFDSRSHALVVADQPGGPESKWADAAAAGSAHGGLAAVNAGFFTPEGAPLGLVMSGGKAAGAWNGASSLGSGVWYETAGGRSGIARRQNLGAASARGMRELIQAGPMLVDQGNAVGGLDAVKTSARTVLLWDGGSRWFMGRSAPCSLDAISRALKGASPAGWPVRMALNLDGGRSAEIWVSRDVSGGPVTIRPLWNKPVRNFLVLKSRSS